MGQRRSAALFAFMLLLAILAFPTAAFALDTTPPVTTLIVQPQESPYYYFSFLVAEESAHTTFFVLDNGEPQVALSELVHVEPSEGPHRLRYWSIDEAYNVETEQIHDFYMDLTPPQMTCNVVQDAEYNQPLTVQIDAQDDHSAVEVIYVLENTEYGPWPSDYTVYSQPFTITETGRYHLIYQVRDESNNWRWEERYFSVDCTAPRSQMTIVDPDTWGGAPEWYTSDVTVNFFGWDPDWRSLGEGALRFRIDGGAWKTVTQDYLPWVDGLISGDGVHTIEYYAVDSFGNEEATNSATIKIDMTPPVATSDVEPGWHKGPYTFSMEATDSVSGLADAALVVYQPNSYMGDGYLESCTLYDEGLYRVYYAARDVAGNQIYYPEVEVGIDNTAPSTFMPWDSWSATSMIDFAQGQQIVFETTDHDDQYGNDPRSGVAATYYRVDEGPWQEGSSFTTQELGHHVLRYYSVDVAGNVEPVRTQDLNVWTYYEQDDPLIRKTGTWSTGLHVDASGGTYATSVNNQTVEFDFLGSGVDFVAPPRKHYHNMDIYVDGVRLRDSVLFEGHIRLMDLPYGVHRVSLISHDSLAGYTDVIGLDAVGVFGTAIPQDLKPPVTTSTIPSTWQRDSVTFTLSATSAIGIDGTTVQVADAPAAAYTGPITISAEGVTPVRYSSVDVTGLREPTQTASVKIDRTAPSTTWSNVGGFQTQNLEATDALSGIHHTSYSVDGGPLQTYAGPFELQPGAHQLAYFSVDMAGNQEATRSADVFVEGADTVAPITTSDAPAGWQNHPVSVTLTPFETGSGIAGISYQLDYGATRPYTAPILVEDDGTHNITFWATDIAGNVETPKSVEVKIDKYGPSVIVDVDEGRVVLGNSIILDPYDPYSGVAAVRYRVDGSVWATGTAVPCPPVGVHVLNYYAVDNIGNVSPTRTDNITVTNRTEQTTTMVGRTGTWITKSDAGASAGSYAVGTAGSTVEAAFDGTAFYLVGPKSPSSGILRVTIDGSTPVLVDAYDKYPVPWRPTLYSKTGLASGRHTVKIEVTGTKNPASSGSSVNIDAFDVVGEMVFWDATPPVTHATVPSGWVNTPVTVSLDATDTQTGVASTFVRDASDNVQPYVTPIIITSEGTTDLRFWSVDMGGMQEDERTATVHIDLSAPDVSASVSDTYIDRAEISIAASDTVSYVDAVEWTTDGTWHSGSTAVIDIPGSHTLRYRARDAAGNVSAEKSAPLTVIGRSDQSDSAIYYDGGWSTASLAGTHGGTYAYLASPGYAEFSFEGSSFAWVATKGNAFGIARVTVDGGEPIAVDLYAAVTQYQQRVLTIDTLPAGRHTVRIEWTGTKNALAKTAYVDVDAVELAGPSSAARREQTEPLLHYSGAWYPGNHASYSGGSYTYLTTPGKVTATFEGSRAHWVATRGAIFGIASVSVDGGSPTDVDLYAPSTTAKQTVFDTGVLTPGRHSITIEYTGRKNPSATKAYVDVDAIDLVGKLVPIRYEQNDDDIYLQGTWIESYSASFSGGSYAYLPSPGSAQINFDGTRIDVIATKGSIFGIAEIRIDGGTPTTVDLYAPTTLYKQPVLAVTGLAPGSHTLTVTYTGTKNPAASSAYINMDALEMVGSLCGQRYEQTDDRLYLDGDWQTLNTPSFSGGSYAFLPSAGSVHLTVDGTRVAIIAAKGRSFGIAEVTIDDRAPVSLDLYASATQYRQTVFEAGGLAPGTHDVVIEWTGRKNPAASNAYINVDAVDLVGQPVLKRFQQDDALVYKTGSWNTITSASYSGRSYSYLANAGGCNISFRGTALELIGTRGPAFGIAKISVDGGTPENVDLYAPTTAHRQVIFRLTGLTPGAHQLTVEWTGSKNAAAASSYINIDALDLNGFLTADSLAGRPTAYEQDDPAITYTGGWLIGASPSYSGGTYRYASSAAQATFRFTGTGARWVATKGSIFGIAEVSIDGGAFQPVDLYAATAQCRQTVWEKSGLAAGSHTVTIRWTGLRSPAASKSYVNIDAVEVLGSLER